jgi:peptidyl-prolyl cis-trans isomerase B (cyclophilin B)
VAPYSSPAMSRRPFTILALATLVVPLVACGGDAAPSTSAGASPVTADQYLAFRQQPTACGAAAPAPAVAMQFDAPGDAAVTTAIEVVIHTSCGPIRLQLDPEAAPETVNSFVFLARQGYFDGTVSHRVAPGFVFQAGDPTASGVGSPGYTIPDELPPAGFAYTRGVVAMANTGAPDSGGSQFFIALDDIGLPPNYTVFGRVVDGFEALDRIAALPMGPNPGDAVASRPLETVYLERVEVLGG